MARYRVRDGFYGYGGFRPYVPVAQRRMKAERRVAALAKKGRVVSPVHIEGRAIARTFWGAAWCENLESYGDYANRLPRGRTYVRNGSVLDLQVAPGRVTALVSGSHIYEIDIAIEPLSRAVWKRIGAECAGKIDSLVELLQGRLDRGVMEVMTRRPGGLFPAPREIRMECSCPDYARLCKHLAAVLYGIGARLDERPDLLFTLRDVDHVDLIGAAGASAVLADASSASEDRSLDGKDLSSIFGIEIDEGPGAASAVASPRARRPGKKRPVAPKARAAARAPKKERASKPRGRARPTVAAKDLVARGVPRPTIQSWLRTGVLIATGRRGIYRTTPESKRRLAARRAKLRE